jgi:hypothetical protein
LSYDNECTPTWPANPTAAADDLNFEGGEFCSKQAAGRKSVECISKFGSGLALPLPE